ncbi:hypothetical protein LCGC14_1850590 [marine sediment metagenome]|uniref:Uncharacterized protein n=1 Tax=marine sediment metagenome TaxID=412755 RepID=A0A0F9GAS4_9ZZZZ
MANITGDIDLGQWLSTMYSDYQTQQTKKESMFGRGISALESYADIFKPGGAYGAGVEAMIGRGEKKAVAGGMQSLVSAGLSNTTMPMHLQQTFQEEVGMPTRLASKDRAMEMYGGALSSIGQAYTGYDPVSPSGYGIAGMATGGYGTMMQGRIADTNAQLAANRQTAENQAGLQSQNMFGGGAGTSGGGGGFSSPYGGSYGGATGDGATGDGARKHPESLASTYGGTFMGGERIVEGTAGTKWADAQRKLKESLAAGGHQAGMSPQATYDMQMKQLQAQMEREQTQADADVFAPSTPIDDPFADYAARISGISAYL